MAPLVDKEATTSRSRWLVSAATPRKVPPRKTSRTPNANNIKLGRLSASVSTSFASESIIGGAAERSSRAGLLPGECQTGKHEQQTDRDHCDAGSFLDYIVTSVD